LFALLARMNGSCAKKSDKARLDRMAMSDGCAGSWAAGMLRSVRRIRRSEGRADFENMQMILSHYRPFHYLPEHTVGTNSNTKPASTTRVRILRRSPSGTSGTPKKEADGRRGSLREFVS